MPGSSLWLVPPPSHPLHTILTNLITSLLPSHLSSSSPSTTTTPRPPTFSPHLTLTSSIDPATYGADPQAWLDGLPFPRRGGGGEVQVRFGRVATEDVFFRRCYIRCGFDGVRGVVAVAREGGVGGDVEGWLGEWREAFGPHVSLV